MQNGPLLFIIIAVALALAMLLVSWLVRRAAQRQMPGSRERGTHWIGRANRRDDDFDGDDL
jgi:hydrogenase-4 membrane subunit HyfE